MIKVKKAIAGARVWNALPDWVVPDGYNLDIVKSRVNQFILGKRVPS